MATIDLYIIALLSLSYKNDIILIEIIVHYMTISILIYTL